jgi:hypothetical protein
MEEQIRKKNIWHGCTTLPGNVVCGAKTSSFCPNDGDVTISLSCPVGDPTVYNNTAFAVVRDFKLVCTVNIQRHKYTVFRVRIKYCVATSVNCAL